MSKLLDTDFTVSAGRAVAVTPHDTNALARTTRGLYVGGAGDLAVILDSDTVAVTFVGVLAGSVLPIRARIVKSTGTTATYILALS